MAGNTIGQIFKLTTFGESHGEAIGGVIDGCPAGLKIDKEFIKNELTRRKPGQSFFATTRKEEDEVVFLSGVFEEHTTGTALAFIVKNTNANSADYVSLKDIYRPSHADYTYEQKYGIRDYRGGGRSSARETIARVVGGAIAKLILQHYEVKITAYTSQIGVVALDLNKEIDFNKIENNIVRCPDEETATQMLSYLEEIKKSNDTAGGIISCIIKNCPLGLGDPIFDKLQADLAKAMLSIPSVKGFEYGAGFEAATKLGSENNDVFLVDNNKNIRTKTNHSGGIQGGISNGEDIYFRIAFKPIASLMQKQKTLNNKKQQIEIEIKGRHDVCVVPRAVPVVEAMAAIVITDHLLRNRTVKLTDIKQN